MSTTKCSRTEAFLTSMGVRWKYSNAVQPKQLKPEWDKENIGRPRAKIEEAMEDYAGRVENGSPMPAPILWKTAKGFVILDGVQRILVLVELLNATKFSAYIIETDSPNLADTIRVLANVLLQGGHQEPADKDRQRGQSGEYVVVELGLGRREQRVGQKRPQEQDQV